MWAFETEQEARNYAIKMLGKLNEKNKPGWSVRTWENCGWHCTLVKEVENNHYTIDFPQYNGTFSVEACVGCHGADEVFWDEDRASSYSDINEAIEIKRKIIQNHIDLIKKLLDNL